MLRGTLRAQGFCKAWDIFVKLGITDDTWKVKNAGEMTYAQFIESFLPDGSGSLKQRIARLCDLNESDVALGLVEWTGILSSTPVPMEEGSPAQILQQLLEKKWLLKTGDKDMVVMQHIFDYFLDGELKRITSSLVVKGEDEVHTAMAKTVGLPAAIAVKMILTGKFKSGGVVVPVMKELYEPVLNELKEHAIVFEEHHA
jgi:saccharopine dehydrogenase-like NADP-dependent oxidoreductase